MAKRIVTRIGNVFCAENNPKESTILYSKSPGKRNGACFGLKILIPGGAGQPVRHGGLFPEEKASLRVTSTGGAVVNVKETALPVVELDLSRCTKGIYLLHIVAGRQETTWKIIKK